MSGRAPPLGQGVDIDVEDGPTSYCLKCHRGPDPEDMAYEEDCQGLCSDCERELEAAGLDPHSYLMGMEAAG